MQFNTDPSGRTTELEALTIYFDGACPVCSREIATYRRQAGADACAWVDVSTCDAAVLGRDLNRDQALARLHVRRADGTLVSGAAAFAQMWQALPATRGLGRVAGWAPVTAVLEVAYRGFLAVRRVWRRPAVAPLALAGPGGSTATGADGALVERGPGAAAPERSDWPARLAGDLRSDHAGETGAVQIYHGILAVSRDEAVRAFAHHHRATEERHLALLEAIAPAVPRSRLLPLWRPAGWLTGALPALIGPRAVYATIAAVETFVDRHYAEQLESIDAALAARPDPALSALRATLAACRDDELRHRDEALAAGPAQGPVARAWAWLVGAGSAAAVALARRV